jgi:hypothetical protein
MALDGRNAAMEKRNSHWLCPQLDGLRSYEWAPVVSLTPHVLQLKMVAGMERMQKLSHPTIDLRPTAALLPRTWRAWQEITVKWGICQFTR